MAQELAEFHSERGELRNQEVTVRRLEERARATEARLAEQVRWWLKTVMLMCQTGPVTLQHLHSRAGRRGAARAEGRHNAEGPSQQAK